MIQFMLKIVYMSLAVLYLYRCCISLVSLISLYLQFFSVTEADANYGGVLLPCL